MVKPIASLLVMLAFTGSLHAKPILDTVEAFSQYRQGIRVTVEQGRGAVNGADTSQDWSNPGANHKP